MTLTEEKLLEIIKKCAFRGKIEEIDDIHNIIDLKVSSVMAKKLLQKHLKNHEIGDFKYRIKVLGLFECWFPRYQSMV